MSFCSHNQCESAAYHESGHIVFAYLNGYSCEGVQLTKTIEMGSEMWSGHSFIDYQTDSFYVSRLIGADAEPDFFDQAGSQSQEKAVGIAHRLSRIYLAGSLTEAIYRNGGNPNIKFPIEVEWFDLVRVEYLNYNLEKLDCRHEPAEFMPTMFSQLLKSIEVPEIWYSIERLARRLRVTKKLNGQEVEEILEEMHILTMHSPHRA